MEFQKVIVGMTSNEFEACKHNDKVFARDENIVNDKSIFPFGFIELELHDPSFFGLTPEPLLCLRNHSNEIIGYFSIKIGHENHFQKLSHAFSSYLVLVYKVCRWLDLPVDKINLYSN